MLHIGEDDKRNKIEQSSSHSTLPGVVEAQCVRDNGTTANNQWLIVPDWLRVRVRVRAVSYTHLTLPTICSV